MPLRLMGGTPMLRLPQSALKGGGAPGRVGLGEEGALGGVGVKRRQRDGGGLAEGQTAGRLAGRNSENPVPVTPSE